MEHYPESQLLETWRAHNRILLFTLANIPAEGLAATLSTRGGKDIAGHFIHLHTMRYYLMEAVDKKLAAEITRFGKDDRPGHGELAEALTQSGEVIEGYLRHALANDHKIKSFKRKALPCMSSIIAHESHHRGHMMLTLKKSGFPLNDNLKFNIWDWNRYTDARAAEEGKVENSAGGTDAEL